MSLGQGFDDTDDIVSFLVEPAWLSYETPRLMADVIDNDMWKHLPGPREPPFPPDLQDDSVVPPKFHCAYEFISVTYECENSPCL